MRTLEQYKELFFKKFPFSKLKILSFEKTKYVLVEDVYGICKVDKFGLMIGNIPTIQTAINLNGSGCQFCGRINVLKYNSENPTGWTKIDWFNAAKKSKKFDSFKVYIIKCWNEEEEFYKIGRTYKKVEYRFSHKKALPYNYKIIQLYEFQELTEENCNKCYDLETEMKKKNKDNSYIPKLEFVGKYEYFNKIKFDF